MTRAYCTRYHLHDLQECERLPKKYFVAFVFLYISNKTATLQRPGSYSLFCARCCVVCTKACHKYLSGVLSLPDLPSDSSFSRLVVLMRRFLHSWFFRCIAYFCLICYIFVNCSPIRAQAVILETILAGASIVTGSIFLGLGMGQDFTQQVLTRIF